MADMRIEKLLFVVAVVATGMASAGEGRLFKFNPAPGQERGRIYYFLPEGVEVAKRPPLLVFLHGGEQSSPDFQPERYFGKDGYCLPVFNEAPFVVAAPSAPPAIDGSRWNRAGVEKIIEATIADAQRRYNIDPDRVFLGGHSMGGFGAYHLGQVLADRLAGVWCSAGAWWSADFRAFYGTPVYLAHGARDCSLADGCAIAPGRPRKHHWCGTAFARAADRLMTRDGVEHVYDEHPDGHSLRQAGAVDALRRFFAWSVDKRRNPYSRKCAVMTLCGSAHPDVVQMTRSRWLEIVETAEGDIRVDSIVLKGPDIIRNEAELSQQSFDLADFYRDGGARIVAENLGGNVLRVELENVETFRIYLSAEMGDLSRPFVVDAGKNGRRTLRAMPVRGEKDYSAVLDWRPRPEDTWDLSALSRIPSFRESPVPETRYPGMKPLLVGGCGPDGSAAEFFCYFAAPEGPKPEKGWPGVVLTHGGGGTAFPNWVDEWRRLGFAVIAPDWYNQCPAPGLTNAAPDEGSVPRLSLPGGRRQDHVANVSNLVLAHTLLRSFPEVNPDRTVYVGLSWGSWYGGIVAAVDPRFKGCVEIYCGDYNPSKRALVNGRYLYAAKVPMYWVISTNDQNVAPDTSNAGFAECARFDGCTIVNDLEHAHCGFSFPSVQRMARYYAGIAPRLPRLGEATVVGNRVSAPVLDSGGGIAFARLAYTLSNDRVTHKRLWRYADAQVEGGVVSATVPTGAVQLYLAAYEAESERHDMCGTTKFVTVSLFEKR